MKPLQQFPENAKFYQSYNFYNDMNGNPRIFYIIYDENMIEIGYCQDNYAGKSFQIGRKELKVLSTIYQKNGIRDFKRSIADLPEFKNEART